MNQQSELIAKTFQGLEEVLAQELTELGADNIEIGRRMVSFTGDKEMMYRTNFLLTHGNPHLKTYQTFYSSKRRRSIRRGKKYRMDGLSQQHGQLCSRCRSVLRNVPTL